MERTTVYIGAYWVGIHLASFLSTFQADSLPASTVLAILKIELAIDNHLQYLVMGLFPKDQAALFDGNCVMGVGT